MHVHNIEVTIQHLCDTCQFEYKCVRFKGIKQALLTVEENALDKWRVDTEIEFNVKRCDLYTADQEKLEAFANQVIDDYLDELDEEDLFPTEDRLADFEEGDEEE